MDSNSEDTAARKTALAERVHTALRNADWPELERSARSYLELDRTEWWFHGALARALRELRRPAEAEDTLQSAMLLLPDGLWLYVDYARLAEHARDWDNALIRWRAVASRWPNIWDALLGEARSLKELQRSDEAKDVLLAARDRFPDQALVWAEYARLSEHLRDFDDAVAAWKRVRDLDNKAPWVHWGYANALRLSGRSDDAENAIAAGRARCPEDRGLASEYAKIAEQRNDWASALARWSSVQAEWPDDIEGYLGEIRTLLSAGEPERATAATLNTTRLFPTAAHLWHDLARDAARRGDWSAAEAAWRPALAVDAKIWWVHAELAHAVREQGRENDAEGILAAAVQLLPDEMWLLTHFARSAERRRDWQAALDRWRGVRTRWPDFDEGHCGEANALRMLGRAEEAGSLLKSTLERLPDQRRIWFEYGLVAEQLDDWSEAERIWRALLQLDDMNWRGYTSLFEALYRRKAFDDADALLVSMVLRFAEAPAMLAIVAEMAMRPHISIGDRTLDELDRLLDAAVANLDTSPEILLGHAYVAREQQNWQKYQKRLSDACMRYPENIRIRALLTDSIETSPPSADTLRQLLSPLVTGHSADAATASNRDLAAAFESLGGGAGAGNEGTAGGCEVGFFQRNFGAEGLGLLRWASIEHANLRLALNERFERLEQDDAFELHEQWHYDWRAINRGYGIAMDHTHLDRGKIDRERASKMVATRFRFLRRKLLDDLELGAKIFVYRLADASATGDEIRALADAVNRYGPNTLLYVWRSPELDARYKIVSVEPGLVKATMKRPAEHGQNAGIWLDMCRDVKVIVDSGATARG